MTKKPVGRPPRPDKAAVQDAFLNAITDGATTKAACAIAKASWGSVSRWMLKDPEFAARHAQAREAAGHMWADKAVDVLDEVPVGSPSECVQLARAKADIYKWRAVVQGRRDYGERKDVDVTSQGQRVAAVIALPVEQEPSAD